MGPARRAMLSGLPYDPRDAELSALRRRAQALMRAYNATIDGEDHSPLISS